MQIGLKIRIGESKIAYGKRKSEIRKTLDTRGVFGVVDDETEI